MRILSALILIVANSLMACTHVNTSTTQTPFAAALEKAEASKHLNAFISFNRVDPSATAPKGRLSGMIIALKDNIHYAELPNTNGTPALENFVPAADAPLVTRLKIEGALILGKTNMHENALGITTYNPHFGIARNPYDLSQMTGGSSGGSAAAVAARIVTAAIGGDTAGSIRIPASLNGIIGFRPSLGRYPGEGIAPLSNTRDVPGPMALTMDHITLLDSVMAARPEVTHTANLKTLRLGVARNPFYADLDPEVAAAMEAALNALRANGVTVIEADMPELAGLTKQSSTPIVAYEAVADLSAYLAKYQTGITFFDLASKVSSPELKPLYAAMAMDANKDGKPDGIVPRQVYDDAISIHRPALIAMYKSYFATHSIDAIIFPTTILPAAPLEGSVETVLHNGRRVPTTDTYIRNTDPGSVAGLPGISLPMGLTKSGLPMGLELDGLPGEDELLLSIAWAVAPLLKSVPAPASIGGGK